MADTATTSTNQIRLTLEDMAFEGAAIGRDDGRVIFADFGIPGEEVIVQIDNEKRRFSDGSVVEVLTPDDSRITPPCPYFGVCGGCQWQHIEYSKQVELKQHVVVEQLRRIGKFDDAPVSPAIGAPEAFGYRNHARFSTNNNGELGFISRASAGREFIRIDQCMLMHPKINEILAVLQDKVPELHQVVIRYGVHTDDLLMQPDLSEIEPSLPGEKNHYYDSLQDHRFQIHASSFFQTNTLQAEVLAELVEDRLELNGGETLVDAYAGVGTFAVLLASKVERIVAIEESASATADAMANIQGYDNIEYHAGKVENILGNLEVTPDAVILDPPRPGCHKRTLRALIEKHVPKLIYVSCNPATLARDLRYLVDGGYTLKDVTPLDMFPQTYHIESVSTLVLE